MKKVFIASVLLGYHLLCPAQFVTRSQIRVVTDDDITNGAERMDFYLPMLQGKKVAVVANHTAMIGNTHLVDTLKASGINIIRVFGPEHGFRGEADAGEKIASTVDAKTGIPLVSLYGKNKKPTPEQISDIDIVVFDIQDVGARFYTYISTMSLVMEACAQQKKKFIILDRPNPNGHFVDGPILQPSYASFVGMHQVPVVHGMTVGEYGCMVSEEGWLEGGVKCDITVVPCLGYDHKVYYQLPIKPSPNLPNMESIYLYPTLCFFEGTVMSLGRGTEYPFQVVGHPLIKNTNFSFTPKSMPGAQKPKLEGQTCHGYYLAEFGKEYIRDLGRIYIFWIIDMYQRFPEKDKFFTSYFNTLAGNKEFKEQIIAGKTEDEIRKTWEPGLQDFKKIRKKYLLYSDFE